MTDTVVPWTWTELMSETAPTCWYAFGAQKWEVWASSYWLAGITRYVFGVN